MYPQRKYGTLQENHPETQPGPQHAWDVWIRRKHYDENAGQFRTGRLWRLQPPGRIGLHREIDPGEPEKTLELEQALEREESVRTQSEARFAEAEEQAAACEKLSEEVEQLRKDLAETQSALEEKTRLASDPQKQVRDRNPKPSPGSA